MKMKKLFLVLFAFALVLCFSGCIDFAVDDGENNEDPWAKIRIVNQSSFRLDYIRYLDINFYPDSLDVGGEVTTEFSTPGKLAPIYFSFWNDDYTANINLKTVDLITLEEEGENEFTFTNNTLVIAIDSDQRGTLREIYDLWIETL